MAVLKYRNENGEYVAIPTGIPNCVSAFENDADYQNAEQVGEAITNELADYYNKSEVDQQYALKTEIPDTTGFITMPEVEEKGYQTEEQVNALIEASGGDVDLSGYYTKDEVDGLVSQSGGGVEQSYVDEMDRLPGRWPTQYRCIKNGGTVNNASFNGYYSQMAMSANSKEDALKYLSLGFPIYNQNASWGSSYYYDITEEDLASIGLSWGGELYNGNTYPMSGTQTLSNYQTVYFQSDGQVNKVNKNSYYYIPKYLNRFWYDNTTSGLNATDIPAAIDELKGMIDTLNAIGVAEQGVY